MAKKLISLLVLTLLIVSVFIVTADAKVRIKNENAERLSHYSFRMERKAEVPSEIVGPGIRSVKPGGNGMSLGITSASPGEIIGGSYRDVQQHSTMSRMIDWRDPFPQIHFAYTYQLSDQDPPDSPRKTSYNVYDPVSGTWPLGSGITGGKAIEAAPRCATYVTLDVDPNNGACVVASHVSDDCNFATVLATVYSNLPPSSYNTFVQSQLDPTPSPINDDGISYPRVEYHEVGANQYTYILAYQYDDVDSISHNTFWRKAGRPTAAGTWEFFDICDSMVSISNSISASRISGKVAVSWVQPIEETDTLINAGSDIYYRINTNYGNSADWGPAVNLTQYDLHANEEGHRAWIEQNSFLDMNDDFHIIWNANMYKPKSQFPDWSNNTRRCRIFHWSSKTDLITTVHDAEWEIIADDYVMCGVGGFNTLSAAKVSISECANRLYVLFVQFGDPLVGDTTDCGSADIFAYNRRANGDLYFCVSSNLDGSDWDKARNLTNSKSPNCNGDDSLCRSDMWPTISRYGMNEDDFPGNDWSNATAAYTVNPGTHDNNSYLDVQYIEDHAPGSAAYGDAGETIYTPANPVKWFRLPCVEPIIEPNIKVNYDGYFYPSYLKHGITRQIKILVENTGNDNLVISNIAAHEETETGSSWVTVDKASMNLAYTVPNNSDTLTMTLSAVGFTPGTVYNLKGEVYFISDDPTPGEDSVYFKMDFPVADTVVNTYWDTCHTNWVGLAVSNNGNMGENYIGEANMDFFNDAFECDNAANYNSEGQDTIPGDATVYFGDGSKIIITDVQGLGTADTTVTVSWSIFDEGFETANGFKPLDDLTSGALSSYEGTGYEAIYTGTYVTHDSTVALEEIYYGPTDDVAYIVKVARLFSFDGSAHDNLIIGEAIDWDIPSDTGSYNTSDSDPINDVLYMRGGEWDEASGDALECMDNDNRYGGASFIGYYTNTNATLQTPNLYGAYAELNETYVYPAGGFVPVELYRLMITNSGLNPQSGSVIADQHAVMTYFDDYDLGATDTLYIVTAIGTVQDESAKATNTIVDVLTAAETWYTDNQSELKTTFCCRGKRGDANCAGGDEPDISDIVRIIDFLYLSKNPLCCKEEADATGNGGDPDISDIVRLIDYLYLSKSPMAHCTLTQ